MEYLLLKWRRQLYIYLGAKFGVKTLAMMTISDSLITQETTSSQERESSFKEMMMFGLEVLAYSF
jgi:purine-nucleoside phosphorylase